MTWRGVLEVQLHSFLASALDRPKWLTSRPRHFTQREGTQVLWQEAGWTPHLVWTFREEEKSAGVETLGSQVCGAVTIETELSALLPWVHLNT